jgi:hypothetical protein
MPIRINLLAEDQAAEDLRRRDPVKRALWICGLLILPVLAWCGSLQLRIMQESEKLGAMQAKLHSQTNEYQHVILSQKQLVEAEQKLLALRQLATNRFLWAPVLNELQRTTVPDVQLLQIKGEQTFQITDEVKPRTNEFGKLIPGKPAIVTEKIALILKARDTGPGPGDQVAKFKETIAAAPYFQNLLGKTNEVKLTNLSAPQDDPESGRRFVQFSLECRLPERLR